MIFQKNANPVLPVILFLSGFTALLYQVIWIREFSLLFGVHVYSVSLVVAVFMAGLALGSFLLGKMADRFPSHATKFFFGIQVLLGLFALLFPFLLDRISALFIQISASNDFSIAATNFLRVVAGFSLLIFPTTLMGGVIPVASKLFVPKIDLTARKISLLYGINNLGAVLGAILTGFVLLATLGTSSTLLLAASINLLIGMAGILVYLVSSNSNSSKIHVEKIDKADIDKKQIIYPGSLVRLALIVFGIEGFATLALQVLWTRLLINFSFEKTIYFTTIVIASFIFGLTVGSFIFRTIFHRIKNKFRFLGTIQVLAGLFTLISFITFNYVAPELIQFRNNFSNWSALVSAEYSFVFLIVMIPSVFTGMSFPLVSHLITSKKETLGSRVGLAGMLDTLGSVAGALVAGFILLPAVGIYFAFIIAVSLHFILGFIIYASHSNYAKKLVLMENGNNDTTTTGAEFSTGKFNRFFTPLSMGFILILSLVLVLFSFPPTRYRQLQESFFKEDKIIFREEGVAATVSVNMQPSGHYALAINGAKTAFTNNDDLRVHKMLAYVPWLLNKEAKSAYVIGFGMGVTAGTLTLLPTETVQVADICPELMHTAPIFAQHNHQVTENAKFTFIPEDGRSFLLRTDKKFDIITSNAVHSRLNPNLYTREFYELCTEKLNPGGVAVQWIPTNWLSTEEFKSLINAFTSTFAYTQLWHITRGHLLLAGSQSRLTINYSDLETLYSDTRFRNDLAEADLFTPQSFLANLLLTNGDLAAFANNPIINTDDLPWVEFSTVTDLKPNTQILAELASIQTEIPLSVNFSNSDIHEIQNTIFDVVLAEKKLLLKTLDDFSKLYHSRNKSVYRLMQTPRHFTELSLNSNWEFRESGTTKWMMATVPGTVHNDLLDNKIVEDPFFRLNENDLQWIEEKDWEYRTLFVADSNIVGSQVQTLRFQGLDTYADVYLNDSLVLQADNMFVEWEVPCRGLVKNGQNELRIVFHSAVNRGMEKLQEIDYILPATNEQAPENERTNVFTRKAPFHYGWDWGPRLVTAGVWRPVSLVSYHAAKIADAYLVTDTVENNTAIIHSEIDIEVTESGNYALQYLVNGELVKTSENLILSVGTNKIPFDASIKNARLWWPNGSGEPYLYHLTFNLVQEDNIIHSWHLDFGVRTIDLVQTPDEIGRSFHFEVNGVPIFMKGANIIPSETLTPAVSPEIYRKMVKSMTDANMNMVRAWGGAIYENDLFYQLCDENGILVWQDFMFACAVQPGDEAHLENIRKEAEYNVNRLKNRACMALWCGNNENLMGWYTWGWKESFETETSDYLWRTYERIFYEILPNAVAKYDPKTSYWPSSPQTWDNQLADRKSGDEHDWTIWFGQKPFESYWEDLPRFVSEWGLQAFPPMETIRSFANEADLNPGSQVMRHRQRSKMNWVEPGFDGNDMITRYMEMYYKVPEDFEEFVYVSQLLQARGYKTAVEAHRSNMPHCMGSLYWQLNDCWPTISWATVDYFYRWKASHYAIRDAFKPLAVNALETEGIIKVFAVNDQLQPINATFKATLLDMQGNEVFSHTEECIVKANTSTILWTNEIENYLVENSRNDLVMHLSLVKADTILAENLIYFSFPKEMNLPAADFSFDIQNTPSGAEIILKSTTLIKNLFIETTDDYAFVSDNFFDMLPGREYKIHIDTRKTLTRNDLKFKFLNPKP